MEEIQCILCGSSKCKDFPAGNKHLNLLPPLCIKKCVRCGLIFMSPRPSSIQREALFNGKIPKELESYTSRPANYGEVTEGRRMQFRKRAEKFQKILKQKGHWPATALDIGASGGTFLEEAKSIGFEVSGIEPSVSGVEQCHKKGLEVILSSAELLPFSDNSFDLVHSNHVFEHLANPIAAIQEAYRVTKPGGIIFIEVPNQLDNIQFFRDRVFNRIPVRRRNIRSIHHLFFLSKGTLRRLLMEGGFKKITISTYYGKMRTGIGRVGSITTRIAGAIYLGGPILRAQGEK